MEQKNTIVKCTANPNCLFNHNGICDNYVITIGADGSCQEYVETEQKTCHPDCIHFDDSDPMVGPICLFKHPEPLKEFYEGMPCDYYHAKNYIRGQRAKGNFYEDTHFNLCSTACQDFDFIGASSYCLSFQEYLGPERLLKPCERFKREKK